MAESTSLAPPIPGTGLRELMQNPGQVMGEACLDADDERAVLSTIEL